MKISIKMTTSRAKPRKIKVRQLVKWIQNPVMRHPTIQAATIVLKATQIVILIGVKNQLSMCGKISKGQ